ncbi:MAG: polynucleotide adenylyltransferase PcnB [Spirochaetota bacterium]
MISVKQAEIHTLEDHGIDRRLVDQDALKVIRRLSANGHSAYVVGGAVRDFLLGKHPKDFDVATDASPNRIKRLFRNSRIIGKRFRLVHIFFREKIIEVSTFRSEEAEGFKNVYGRIEEDVKRRDFTCNALYYSPEEQSILDYVGGVKDIRARRLRPVIPLDRIFEEDPVRMVRAVKYSAAGGFRISPGLKRQMRKSASLIGEVSPSRMTEEVFKILTSGYSRKIIEELLQFNLLRYMLPNVDHLLRDRAFADYRRRFFESLSLLDKEKDGWSDGSVAEEGSPNTGSREAVKRAGGHQANGQDELTREKALAYFASDFLFTVSEQANQPRISFKTAFTELKHFIRPVTPANRDVEKALVYLIRKRKKYQRTGHL